MEMTKKATLLIADDEADLRGALAFDFQRKGYRVLEADNGRTALEIILKEKVDVVISDIRMPGGDGVELLDGLKKNHPLLPVVIFVTGHADIGLDEAYEKGAEAVLSKPFDRKLLHQLVARSLMPLPQRWSAPAEPALPQERRLERKLASLSSAESSHQLLLGHGGFYLAGSPTGKVGEKVRFEFAFSDESGLPHLGGHGIVRWVREEGGDGRPAGMGVEISALDSPCLAEFIRRIEKKHDAVFIPRG